MISRFPALAVLLFLCVQSGWCGPVVLRPQGDFTIDGLSFRIRCFNESWKGFSQSEKSWTVTGQTECGRELAIRSPGLEGGVLREELIPTGENRYRYTAEVRLPAGRKVQQVALDLSGPADFFAGMKIGIDAETFVFPPRLLDTKDPFNLLWKKGSRVVFPLAGSRVTLSGATPFLVLVQDDRVSGWDGFSVRVLLPETGKETNLYRIELELLVEPYRFAPVDLKKACTASLEDETADDRKGGWTDQGRENDLRMLPPGKVLRLRGVPFEIIDAGKNGGKSAIVLRGPFRDYFPSSAEVEPEKPLEGRFLYLLHATAWPSAGNNGEIAVEYADGSRTVLPVAGGREVGNWWQPQELPNGKVVWTGENRSSFVGLYRSAFELSGKPVRKLAFRSTGGAVWGIVAATLSDTRLPEKENGGPVYIREGADWKPIPFFKDMEKGSVLDFSGLLDAPAGKYGPVTVRNGHFEFRDRPGVPVRFYGTNLVDTAQFPTHEWAERIADRMAQSGFNLIRIHHHDNGLSVRRDGTSTALNPENLERLNYLIGCFKKRGIYVITDCYVSRTFTPEEYDAWGSRSFKNLVFLDRSAMDSWKGFVRNWFTAENPCTGMALKDDPVLIGVNLINEGNLGTSWRGAEKQHEAAFAAWLKANGKEKELTSGTREKLFAAYIGDLYRKGFDEMKSFLRDELGMQKPVSDQNHRSEWVSGIYRDRYDFVDNHYYFDHPSYPETAWRLPARVENVSSIPLGCVDLGWMFPTRIWNKPMIITEFDYAKPNFYRAEGAVLTGAYAGLQDWDGLVQFAYAHGFGPVAAEQNVANPFDLAADVVKSLSHRIGVKLFLEREVRPAPAKLAVAFTGPENMDFSMSPSRNLRNLGFVAQLGLVVLPGGEKDHAKLPENLNALLNTGNNFPSGIKGVAVADANVSPEELRKRGILSGKSGAFEAGIFRSEGGQLELDTVREAFRASAPGIDVLILPAKQSGAAGFMAIDNRVGRGVFSLQSVDGKVLAESKRMLFLHLTDSQGSLIKFDDGRMKQHSTWGKAQHLAARGEADIRIALPAGKYRLFSCDTAGKRLAEIPISTGIDGRLEFEVKVFRPEGQVFVYELARE